MYVLGFLKQKISFWGVSGSGCKPITWGSEHLPGPLKKDQRWDVFWIVLVGFLVPKHLGTEALLLDLAPRLTDVVITAPWSIVFWDQHDNMRAEGCL